MEASGRQNQRPDVEDELAIRALLARFSDACIRGDVPQFRETWVEEGIWAIGNPFEKNCEGIEAILEHLHFLRDGLHFFTQFVSHGVLEVDGDRATVRSPIWEMATSSGGHFYNNLGLYHDVVIKRDGIWRFSERRYEYLWLSTDPFPGNAVGR